MHTLKTRWLWITLLLLTLACSGLPGGELIGGNHDEGGAPLQQLGESRAQPYPANTVVFTENARVKVNGFIRGAAAWELLHEANQFNQPPPEGWEYLLVDLDLRWTGKDSEFRWLSCTVTGSALRVHQAFAAVVPEPRAKFDFRSQKHSAGWAAYLIQEGEGNLIVIVEETGNMESAPRYIALEDNAAILVDLALLDIEPTAVGSDLNAPAPLGTTVTTKDWEITALDVIRGEKAWQAIIEANQFNAPPPAGVDYVLILIAIRYIGIAEGPQFVPEYRLRLYKGDGRTYAIPAVVEPEPHFDARLFPGGRHEGWIALTAPDDKTDPILVYATSVNLDIGETRYLRLGP